MQISAALYRQALIEQVSVAYEAKETWLREQALRDDAIRDALEVGMSYKSLMSITGLSRDRLYTIATQPYSIHHKG